MASTRERILAEATSQLSEHGLESFTVAGVRDSLGLASGSMFHAFASRAALAATVYVEGMADYQRTVLAALDPTEDAEAGIRALIDSHLGWIEDHPGLARFLFATLPADVAAAAEAPLKAHNDMFFGALDRFYDRLTLAGLVERGVERRVAHAICIGPSQEYCRQWTRTGGGPLPRQLSPTFQAAALAAVRSARSPIA